MSQYAWRGPIYQQLRELRKTSLLARLYFDTPTVDLAMAIQLRYALRTINWTLEYMSYAR